ncbi:MAG: Fic family protein [Acidobacteria bacterium]|nr:Fic family protein [Acidobacteriota bacterium]
MKRPLAPPPLEKLLERHKQRLPDVLRLGGQPTVGGHYIHWDQLRRKTPRPADLSAGEWWTGIRLARFSQSRPLPLEDTRGRPFLYMLPDRVLEALHRIDSGASGRIGVTEAVTNPATRDQFIVSSLIREAITSSQLEGASTTRAAAARMIRAGRRPRNRSERMILNNYRAMREVREMKDQPLTVEAVLALHRAVTDGTLDDPAAAGRLQLPGEDRVEVCDAQGQILHRPPPADRLPERLRAMVRFANAENGADTPHGNPFLHPVIRAIVLHFWLAYDHPFADGNGRTARALFYWAMLRRGYWMFEFLSISRFLKAAPVQYAQAFLHTETDASDATYFIVHQVDVIQRALDALDRYLQLKAAQAARIDRLLRRGTDLNHRQLALLAHAVRHPDWEYTTRSHMTSHDVVYATARADLFRLAELSLLERQKRGRKLNVFRAPSDLEARIRGLRAVL